ncbi:uncharacterized protein UTRI_05354 [Ustilago trichophora]|uniref:Uncharacterized protein n=1 Tax=Ustilago trichophora TaxID=86804 RepID=A0A5C3ELW9_9BASI|nr:uncharacterized protein UTRI_05354 [Ustilago trichophora]
MEHHSAQSQSAAIDPLLRLTNRHFRSLSVPPATSSEAASKIGAAGTISRPSSVSYRRSPSWSGALSDSSRTPAPGSEQDHNASTSTALARLEGLAIAIHGNTAQTSRGQSAQTRSWPFLADNYASQRRMSSQSDTALMWSVDAANKPSRKQMSPARGQERISWDRSRYLREIQNTPPLESTHQHHVSFSSQRLSHSHHAEALSLEPLTPVTASRRSPASASTSQPNTPSVLTTGDWSFLHSFLRSSPENASTALGSPVSGRRPGSGNTSRDFTLRSPLSPPIHSWAQLQQTVGNDDDEACRSITPATVRPGSGALEPILESASMDQDTSLADTSAFVFDRYRFSGASAKSEPADTSRRSSPVPAIHSEAATGQASSVSSRGTDLSTQGSTAGFRPKELVLTGASRLQGHKRASSRLSRSISVPLLTLQTTPTDNSPHVDYAERANSETAGSPLSARAYLTPTPTFTTFPWSPPPPPHNSNPIVSGKDRESSYIADALREVKEPQTAHQPSKMTLAEQDELFCRSVPANISTSRPPGPAAVAVEEDDNADSMDVLRPQPAQRVSSQLTSKECTSVTTPAKSQLSPDADATRSLRSESLSPPRSAASAETRSSGTVELVSWHVATTDLTGPRRSEEIFRPLSTAMAMSRSGPGSSRNTVVSGSLPQTAAGRTSSYRSSMQMPQTPLKGGTDFMWGRPESRNRDVEGRVGSSTGGNVRREGQLGLGFSVPVASTGIAAGSIAYPDMGRHSTVAQARDDEQVEKGTSRRSGGEYRISSPPGAMRRLLFELEHGSTDDPVSRVTGSRPEFGDGGPWGDGHINARAYHQRSSTLSCIEILPRSSSMRRRHQSIDVDGRQSRILADRSAATGGLEAVAELPPGLVIDSGSSFRVAPHKNKGFERTERNISNPDSSTAPIAQGRSARLVASTRIKIGLELFTIVYQSLYFAFESPYLWKTITPALPLVASSLFLALNILILQMHTLQPVHHKLYLVFVLLTIPTFLYCSSTCGLKIIRLVHTLDHGASAPGIHFSHIRARKKNAFTQVLRNTPMSAVLLGLGVMGALIGLALTTMQLKQQMDRRRTRRTRSSSML